MHECALQNCKEKLLYEFGFIHFNLSAYSSKYYPLKSVVSFMIAIGTRGKGVCSAGKYQCGGAHSKS